MREIASFAAIIVCIIAVVALKPAEKVDRQVIVEKPIIKEVPVEKVIVKEVPKVTEKEVPKIIEKQVPVFVPRPAPPAFILRRPLIAARPACSRWSYFRMDNRVYRYRRCHH